MKRSLPVVLTLLLALPAVAQQVLYTEDADPAVFGQTQRTVDVGLFESTSQPPLSIDGYAFTHWTLNGARQDGPDGQAKVQAGFEVLGTTLATAHYLPQDDDANVNGTADWQEVRFYGGLEVGIVGGSYDHDGDGFAHDHENSRGYPLVTADTLKKGGIGFGFSPSFYYDATHVRCVLRSQPPGFLAGQTLDEFRSIGSSVITPVPPRLANGYAFSHWTVNGVRRPLVGRAATQLLVHIDQETEILAQYLPANLDTDGDQIADWRELQLFGTLDGDLASDQDGDAFDFEHEKSRGYPPLLANESVAGGVAIGFAPDCTFRNESQYVRCLTRSEPVGLVQLTIEYLAKDSIKASPVFPATIGSYTFAYWSVNDERQPRAGRASTQVAYAVTRDTEFVAHFFPSTEDSDSDGIDDWREWQYFGDLAGAQASDQDGDGFDFEHEESRGYAPVLANEPVAGGISFGFSPDCTFWNEWQFVRCMTRSDPAGLVGQTIEYLAKDSTKASPFFPTTIAGYNFAYWIVNGERQPPTGRASTQVAYVVTRDTEFVAHYFPNAEDSDSDGIADWREWQYFGGLAGDQASDQDGDGFPFAHEEGRGFPPPVPDRPNTGGIALGFGVAATYHNESSYVRYSIGSNPPSLIGPQLAYIPTGDPVTTPLAPTNVSGYGFCYWSINGERQSLSGRVPTRVQRAIATDTEFVAHYLPASEDSDGDGMADWSEWLYFGGLGSDGSSDPDGDGLSTFHEERRGFASWIPDRPVAGGIAFGFGPTRQRGHYFFSEPYLLHNGLLEDWFATVPYQEGEVVRLGDLWEGVLTEVVGAEQFPVLGDWDGDGDYELFVYRSDRVLEAFENIGSSFVVNLADRSGEFGALAATIGALPDDMLGVSLGDWDGDGDEDLIFGYNTGVPPVGELLVVDSPGSLAGPVPAVTSTVALPELSSGQYRAVALGDVNGDGLADLVVGVGDASATSEVRVYLRLDAMSGFDEATVPSVDLTGLMSGREHVSLAVSREHDDADKSHIYAASLYGQIFKLDYGISGGSFAVARTDWAATYPGFAQVPRIAVADLDGDGDSDLVASFVDVDGDAFVAGAGGGAPEPPEGEGDEGGPPGFPFKSRLLRTNDPRLAAPFQLTATNGARSILVEWEPNREYQLDGYFIYRGLSATGPWTRIQAVSTEQRRYVDGDPALLGGVDYYYQVTAITRVWSPGSARPALYEGPPSVSNAARVEAVLFALGEPARHDSGTIILPVTAEYGADIAGAGMELRFGYNKTLLTPTRIETSAASKDLVFTDNLGEADGEIVITGTGGSLRGAGLIFLIHFAEVMPDPAESNGDVEVAEEGGIPDGIFTLNVVAIRDINNQVLVPPPPDQVDLFLAQMGLSADINGDGVVTQGDIAALVSRIIQGRRDPASVATVLPVSDLNGSGAMDVGDIPELYKRLAQGGTAEPDVPDYEITTSERTGQAGTHISVPLAINDAGGLSAVYLQVNYDPNLLSFQNAQRPAGSLGANFESVHGEDDGVIYVVLYRDSSLASGSGTLVDLDFEVNGGARPGMAADVIVADVGLASDSGALAWWNSTVDQGKTRMWVTLSHLIDSDGDGVSDYDEQLANGRPDYDPYDPVRNPFGRDTIYDSADSDGDGFLDGWEQRFGWNMFGVEALWADTDGDGILDFYEQAFGSDPLKWDEPPVFFGMHKVGGVDYPGITYRRLKSPPTGMSYLHEVSDELEEWLSGAGTTEEITVSPFDELYDEVRSRDTRSPIGKGFSRVRVEGP